MRLALAQINPTVGDLVGNLKKIIEFTNRANEQTADLVCFPELALCGYPPEDLLLKPAFLEDCRTVLEKLVQFSETVDTALVVGCVDWAEGDVFNAAAVIHGGRLSAMYRKIFLPNYGVFDEKRYFRQGDNPLVCTCRGLHLGITICEDLWHPVGPAVMEIREGGAELILNLSASPYHRGKQHSRETMLGVRASDMVAYIAFVNAVGAQDELVFDGNSIVFDERGRLIARGASFEEDLLLVDIPPANILRTRLHDIRHRETFFMAGASEPVRRILLSAPQRRDYPPLPGTPSPSRFPALPGREEESAVYAALTLGVHDYMRKNGFERVYLGLSGGIDSALAGAIAVDALGKEQVVGVFLPASFTAPDNREDVQCLAQNLGIALLEIPIEEIYQAYLKTLQSPFNQAPADLTSQNIQARIRGNLLMALANQNRGVVLTTGNKSELSVGYVTLYGDLAGGYAVLKDVLKTFIYRLARYRNQLANSDLIPQRIFEKAPSAELKPGQKDEDDLPPYAVLDQIIERYVEQDQSLPEIAAQGLEFALVRQIIEKIDRNEYKRRQSPPGVKITFRAFGKDRRMPIINRYQED